MHQSYRDVPAWQKAMQLVKATYALTGTFPNEEMYGLTALIRRTAVAVPSNIAAGQALGQKEYLKYLSTTRGSLAELQTQLQVAIDIGFATTESTSSVVAMAEEVDHLIESLYSSVDVGWNRSTI